MSAAEIEEESGGSSRQSYDPIPEQVEEQGNDQSPSDDQRDRLRRRVSLQMGRGSEGSGQVSPKSSSPQKGGSSAGPVPTAKTGTV